VAAVPPSGAYKQLTTVLGMLNVANPPDAFVTVHVHASLARQ
jgi:hypothetical protein